MLLISFRVPDVTLHKNFKEDVPSSRPVRDCRFYELMKMISRLEHCAARQKNTRQKSISPDNPRLTARTSLEGDGPRNREGEHREELAKTALEIIVVITRSCGTRVPTAGIKEERERKRRRGRRKESCPRIQYPRETCPDFIEKRRERRESQEESAAARSPVLPRSRRP